MGNLIAAPKAGKAHGDARNCGAKAKSTGKPCTQPAGWGTSHPGEGRCKFHGGASNGRPITHGRYSLKHRQSLADKAEQFEQFEGSVAAELSLLRVLLQDFVDRFEDGVQLRVADIASIKDLADSIGRMEERSARIRKDTAFGAQEMSLFVAAMSSVLQKYVDDDSLPDALSELRSILRSG